MARVVLCRLDVVNHAEKLKYALAALKLYLGLLNVTESGNHKLVQQSGEAKLK
jgi:hypothetical protein